MGNWLGWNRRQTPSAPTIPTIDDYARYISDLTAIQESIQWFIDVDITIGIQAGMTMEKLGEGFDGALTTKQEQLQRIKLHVEQRMRQIDGGGATGETPEELKVLGDMADVVEALCNQAKEKFDYLKTLQVSAPLPQQLPPSPPPPSSQPTNIDGLLSFEMQTFVGTHSNEGAAEHTLPAQGLGQLSVTGTVGEMDLQLLDVGNLSTDVTSVNDWASDFHSSLPQDMKLQTTKLRVNRHANDRLETCLDFYEQLRDRPLSRRLFVEFDGESGLDGGALSKEFFEMVFQDILRSTYKGCPLMEGKPGHFLPNGMKAHLVHVYKSIGMMIAHAVRNGCRGLPDLSPAIKFYLINMNGAAFIEENLPPMSIDDIADHELCNILGKLHRHEELTDDENVVFLSWMERASCPVVLSPATCDLIVQTLMVYYIFLSRISQLDAMAKGLEKLNFRRFLHENSSPSNVSFVFPLPEEMIISAKAFMAVVIVRQDRHDEKVLGFLEQFVTDLSRGNIAGKNICDLIRFLSGSSYLPQQVNVLFRDNICYPAAHACFNELELPVMHRDYNRFRDAIIYSLEHGTGFME